MARSNPVKAPRNPSVTERLLKVRRPRPVSRNPEYAIAPVQKIPRSFMGFSNLAGIHNLVTKWLAALNLKSISILLATFTFRILSVGETYTVRTGFAHHIICRNPSAPALGRPRGRGG